MLSGYEVWVTLRMQFFLEQYKNIYPTEKKSLIQPEARLIVRLLREMSLIKALYSISLSTIYHIFNLLKKLYKEVIYKYTY